MAKVKISQWDVVAANNTDINSININEGCPPSTINNAIREMMSQVKDLQGGYSGDTIPVAAGGTGATTAGAARTNLGITGTATQDPSSVNFTGGSITGLTNLSTGIFSATGATTLSGATTASSTLTSSGSLAINGSVYLDGSLGTNGQVLTSVGSTNTPIWASLGTMSTQNNTSVNIDGGTINGTTVNNHTVGSNATGNKYVSTGNPSGGSNGDVWYKV